MPLHSAPTFHEKLVQAKIEHIAKVTLDLRQKRAITEMKELPKADSINMTENAQYHQQIAEERVAHKKDRDEQYNAKISMQVLRTLRRWEESRSKEERQMVSAFYFTVQEFGYEILMLTCKSPVCSDHDHQKVHL